jgi:hypothetical protein
MSVCEHRLHNVQPSLVRDEHRRPTTHERYLHAVRDLIISRAQERSAITSEQAQRLSHTRLLNGGG